MSIYGALYTGVSGLSAESDALSVIGDNVSNSNTVGFKESRAVFEDVMGTAMGQPGAIGSGVHMQGAQQIFTQGSMLNTGQPTDIALSGDGFFVVNGTVNGVSGNFYTRNGETQLNSSGQLVNPQGLALQGYQAVQSGGFSSHLGAIQVPTAALPPKTTTTMSITANLSATAAQPAAAWDPQNPTATSNVSTSMTVFDSLGDPHSVDVYFRNDGGNSWEYHALAAGSDVAGGTAGQNTEIAGGTITFNASGGIDSIATTGGTVDFNGAQPGQAIALNLGTPVSAGGTGLNGITQFGSPSNISAQSQDGYASGSLSGVSIDQNGVVSGNYTNGQTVAVAQLAIAKFPSNDGLARAGDSLWSATQQSGLASLGAASAGGRGGVVSGSLEQSNVDIATQFVDLIAHQSSFQANSKTITTADQMLQSLIAMKQ